MQTIGVQFIAKRLQIGDTSLALAIWDPCGQERYRSLVKLYYQGASVALICYDITLADSFEQAQYWVDNINNHNTENCMKYLVGTKLDLVEDGEFERAVPAIRVTKYAEEIGAVAMETSSKTGFNIDELFARLSSDYIESDQIPKARDGSTICLDARDNLDDVKKTRKRCTQCSGRRQPNTTVTQL
ncbi:ras-related protein Rab-24-like isoform X2 [Apostichopus japonicus]|uniref:ras-related protein Rab-24-like isoform X2 n=1 Tax=Stichopus japonicus TaxID=307972 RepID=UPI003AB5749F